MTKHILQAAIRSSASLSLPLLIAACSTADAPKPPPVQQVVQRPAAKEVTVTEADANARIVLERSQRLVVRLATSGSERSEWSVVDLKPGSLALIDSKFEFAPRDVNPLESFGWSVWRFQTPAAGEQTLRFELRRPRSLEPASQTVSYAVTVK